MQSEENCIWRWQAKKHYGTIMLLSSSWQSDLLINFKELTINPSQLPIAKYTVYISFSQEFKSHFQMEGKCNSCEICRSHAQKLLEKTVAPAFQHVTKIHYECSVQDKPKWKVSQFSQSKTVSSTISNGTNVYSAVNLTHLAMSELWIVYTIISLLINNNTKLHNGAGKMMETWNRSVPVSWTNSLNNNHLSAQ